MKTFKTILLFSILLTVVACSKTGPSFTVEGKITDADTTMLYLEKRELNSTTILDSVKLTSQGNFKFTNPAPTYPEFYVLRLNGQVINLAIDSTETIKINSSKKDFATVYNSEGSQTNELLKKITLAQYKSNQSILDLQNKFNSKEIIETDYIEGIRNTATEYKELVKPIIFSNLKSPAAYFALFQKVGGLLFFDPYDNSDYKAFAAVATAWDTDYPSSQRSQQLKNFTLQAMKVRKQNELVSIDINNLNEITSDRYYNIELPDINNTMIKLSSLKGKVVLLDFTVYQTEESPLHNMDLNKIYTKLKDNLEIYQVSLDSDTHFWKNAAINIPWIAVHDELSINSPLLLKFNIQELPSMYLLNKNGEMVKRLTSKDNIEAEIQRLL